MLEVSPKLGPVHTPRSRELALRLPRATQRFCCHLLLPAPEVATLLLSAGQAPYSVAAGIGDEPGGNSGYAKSIKRKDDSAVAAIDALASEAQWLSIIGLSWRPSHFSLGIASAAYDAPE